MDSSKKRSLAEQVRRFRARFAQSVGAVLGEVIPAELLTEWVTEEAGRWRERTYGPLQTLRLFLEQVLSADQSCQDAVARGLSERVAHGEAPCSLNSGPYCEARQRLPLGLAVRVAREAGARLSAQQPRAWRWRDRPLKLVDGTTVSMPDTAKNQARFPQSRKQKAGLGFPLARLVAIVSLSCGAVLEWAVAACEGKQTGETALLWGLAQQLERGDVVIADRCYAGYFMIAWLGMLGVDVVMRQHQSRHTDFRRGKRLGVRDHVVNWVRPQRPAWMDEATYEAMPATLSLREARAGGWTLVSTLVDARDVSKRELLELYRQRWQVGVSGEGHIVQSVKVRPGPRDSSPVAWEAPWRESKTAKPSDNGLDREVAQRTRLQRTVNADVASLHESPVAETVYNARKQQGLAETSPIRRLSPAEFPTSAFG